MGNVLISTGSPSKSGSLNIVSNLYGVGTPYSYVYERSIILLSFTDIESSNVKRPLIYRSYMYDRETDTRTQLCIDLSSTKFIVLTFSETGFTCTTVSGNYMYNVIEIQKP